MKRPFRAAAWLLLASSAARAQTSPPAAPLRLADALRLAHERNPVLRSARADVDSADAQREIAAQIPNPTFTWTTAKIPTDGTPASTVYGNGLFDRSYDSILALGQLVEVGGKRGSRRASAAEGLAAARARLADADRTLAAAVVRSYVAALVADAGAEAARRSARSFERTVALAREREKAGDVSSSERAQVEIAGGRFEADATLAELAARNARRVLGALLDVPEPALADALEPLAAAAAAASRDASDDEAAANRPDLLALAASVRKAESDLAFQKTLRVPDPTVLAQYEREPPDQRNTVGIGVSIPLPVFHQNAGAIRVAAATLESARQDLARGRLAARVDLGSTRDALTAAVERARLFGDELLPRAERVRDTVEYAYGQGAASLLELLEAERSANEIRAATAAARGDVVGARADFAAARLLPVLPEGHER